MGAVSVLFCRKASPASDYRTGEASPEIWRSPVTWRVRLVLPLCSAGWTRSRLRSWISGWTCRKRAIWWSSPARWTLTSLPGNKRASLFFCSGFDPRKAGRKKAGNSGGRPVRAYRKLFVWESRLSFSSSTRTSGLVSLLRSNFWRSSEFRLACHQAGDQQQKNIVRIIMPPILVMMKRPSRTSTFPSG